MTPSQLIKKVILEDAVLNDAIKPINPNSINESNVEDLYAEFLEEEDLHWDYESDFREGEVETDIPSEYSRHYESKSVAAKIGDQWVGWTYWYGGGKHGNPEEIEWMDEAYYLDVTEEKKLVTVYNWSKKCE